MHNHVLGSNLIKYLFIYVLKLTLIGKLLSKTDTIIVFWYTPYLLWERWT